MEKDHKEIRYISKGYQDLDMPRPKIKTGFNGSLNRPLKEIKQSPFNNIPYGYDNEGNLDNDNYPTP